MEINWMAVVLSGLVPVLLGMFWYSPRVFGAFWQGPKEQVAEYQMEGTNQILKFGLTFSIWHFGLHCGYATQCASDGCVFAASRFPRRT